MTLPPDTSKHHAADLRQVLMDGGIELMGPEEASILFASPKEAATDGVFLSSIYANLKRHYGEREGRGVALRLGRAAFQIGLRRWGDASGITRPEFRLQPSPRKVRGVLALLAGQMSRSFGSNASLSEDERCWRWRVETCPVCVGHPGPGPDCHLIAGMLQEMLSWAGGGRYFRVEEIECMAGGAPACTFLIEKKALD